MRANDIEKLRGELPPKVIYILRSMYEEQQAIKQQVATLAGMFDRMCSMLNTNMQATASLHNMLPHVRALKEQGMEVGSDPSITGSMDDDDPERVN